MPGGITVPQITQIDHSLLWTPGQPTECGAPNGGSRTLSVLADRWG